MINQKEAEKFVYGVFTDVWCNRNHDAVAKYYHKDFVGLLHGTEEFCYSDVLKRVEYSKDRYLNPRCTFNDIFVSDNDRIVARVSMSAYDKNHQEVETIHMTSIFEMCENTMIRQWTSSNQIYRYKDWE